MQEAQSQLLSVLAQQLQLVEAHAQLGKLWIQTAPERMPEWNQALPTAAEQHPDIWYVRGQWARSLERTALAAAYELYLQSEQRLQPILAAARLTLQLGRVWEAFAWSQYGLSSNPGHTQLQHVAQQAQQQLQMFSSSESRQRHHFDQTWLSTLTLPDWNGLQGLDAVTADAGSIKADGQLANEFTVAFEEVPLALDFEYFASRSSFADGRRMFEMTGGGVGILDFDGDGWPDIFLAQGSSWPPGSASPAHCDRLLRNLGASRGEQLPEFHNCTQAACINDQQFGQGVAIGDVNGDGALDLFVTNYHDESNTLYVQHPDGSFLDGTGSTGLATASLPMLGFGTQFIDAQLDGWADLLVLNGHIDDLTHLGIPYQMRPQFFVGKSGMQFQLSGADETGDFFQHERLGRSLAWLDFDRDGKQDFVAGKLDGPTRLIRNMSIAGNYLAINLVGTHSHRDAIGSQVRVTAGEQMWTQQLVAGGGYMATNQRTLHFGLGAIEEVERVDIDWPSGLRQTFGPLKANTRWLAVENGGMQPLR